MPQCREPAVVHHLSTSRTAWPRCTVNPPTTPCALTNVCYLTNYSTKWWGCSLLLLTYFISHEISSWRFRISHILLLFCPLTIIAIINMKRNKRDCVSQYTPLSTSPTDAARLRPIEWRQGAADSQCVSEEAPVSAVWNKAGITALVPFPSVYTHTPLAFISLFNWPHLPLRGIRWLFYPLSRNGSVSFRICGSWQVLMLHTVNWLYVTDFPPISPQ